MPVRLFARANALDPELWSVLPAVSAIGYLTLTVAAFGMIHPGVASAQSAASAGVGSPALKAAASSRPLWTDLKPDQQEALQPLAPHWSELGEAHKRKWIALSRNYAALSPEGRRTLHSRMSEWAGLSFQQRAQARLNFAEVQQIATDERKAKWEAYQALTDDQRSKLAGRATARSPGAALALQPVPVTKLAPTPAVASAQTHAPRIQLAPPVPAPAPPPTPRGAPVPQEAQTPPPDSSPAAQ